MREEKLGEYTIAVWAERVGQGWTGLASVKPPIPNTWTGGPKGDSLITDGIHESELVAEDAAINEAMLAINSHQRSKG